MEQLGNGQQSSQYIATEPQQQRSQESVMVSNRQKGSQAAATIADYSDDLASMDCDGLFEDPEYDFSPDFGIGDDITRELLDSINFGPWDDNEWPSPFHDDEFEMLGNFGAACDEHAIHGDNHQFINNNGISTSTHQQQSVLVKGKAPVVVDGATPDRASGSHYGGVNTGAGPSSSSFFTVPSGGNDSISTNYACSLGTLHIVTDNYKRVLGDEFVPENGTAWSSAGNMISTGGMINGSSGPGANAGCILTHYGQQLINERRSSHQQQSVSATDGNSYQELISNRKWMPTQENQASSSSHWGASTNNFGVVLHDQHVKAGITRNFVNMTISPSMMSGCGGQGLHNGGGVVSDHTMINPTIGTSANLNGTHGSPMKSSADQDCSIPPHAKRAKKGNREGEAVKKRTVGRPPKGSTSSSGNKKPMDDSKKSVVINAHSIQVGEWKKITKTGCDLSLKCYFGFHQLVWEFLCKEKEMTTTVYNKYRMVVDWKNILSIKTHKLTNGNDVLQVKLNHKPKFDQEKGPVCKKHSTWKPCRDFTSGEAEKSLMIHELEFKPGLLSSNLNKMLKGSSELRQVFENLSPHVSSSTAAMLPSTPMQPEQPVVQGQVHDSSHAMQLVHHQPDSFQSRADMSLNIQGTHSGAYEQSDGTNSPFYNPP